MGRKAILRTALAWVLLVGASQAGQPGDRIEFRDGDRVTGTLVYLRDGMLGFSAWASPEVKAPVSAVASITATGSYAITLVGGSRLRGALLPGEEPGSALVETEAGGIPIVLAKVTGIETVAEVERRATAEAEDRKLALRKVWKGNVNLAYSEASGNTQLRNVLVSSEATRTTKVDKLRLSALTNTAFNQTTKTADRTWGEARLDIFLNDRSYYFLQGRIEADELGGIDLRTALGAGLGRKWKLPELRRETSLGLGYSFVREAFSNGRGDTQGTLLLTFDHERDLGPNLRLEHHLVAYPEVSTGDYRFQAQTNFASKIRNDLSFTIGFLNKYDSDPPAGFEKSDFTITSGLRKDF